MANRRLEAASWDLVDQDTGELISLRLETSNVDMMENDQIVAGPGRAGLPFGGAATLAGEPEFLS